MFEACALPETGQWPDGTRAASPSGEVPRTSAGRAPGRPATEVPVWSDEPVTRAREGRLSSPAPHPAARGLRVPHRQGRSAGRSGSGGASSWRDAPPGCGRRATSGGRWTPRGRRRAAGLQETSDARRTPGVTRQAASVMRRATGDGRRTSGVRRRATGVMRQASCDRRQASGVMRRASCDGRRVAGVSARRFRTGPGGAPSRPPRLGWRRRACPGCWTRARSPSWPR